MVTFNITAFMFPIHSCINWIGFNFKIRQRLMSPRTMPQGKRFPRPRAESGSEVQHQVGGLLAPWNELSTGRLSTPDNCSYTLVSYFRK